MGNRLTERLMLDGFLSRSIIDDKGSEQITQTLLERTFN